MSDSIDALSALWQESERRLYPLATTVPQKYEQVVRLARAVANTLAHVASSDALAAAWGQRSAAVAAASLESGVPLGDLPELDVAGVAFALRHREVRAIEHEQAQRVLVAAARDRGDEWVVLHERGTPIHGLMDPYQAVEMHLASGTAIVSTVEPSLTTGAATYVLSVVRMDPESGVIVDVDPRIAEVIEVDDGDSFERERADVSMLAAVNSAFPFVDALARFLIGKAGGAAAARTARRPRTCQQTCQHTNRFAARIAASSIACCWPSTAGTNTG